MDNGDARQTRSSFPATDQPSPAENICIPFWFQAQDRHSRRPRSTRCPRRTANSQAEEGHSTSVASPPYHLADSRFVGFSPDANFPVGPPAFSTRPSQSPHAPALPSGKKITGSTPFSYPHLSFTSLHPHTFLYLTRKQSRPQSFLRHSSSLTMTRTPSGYSVFHGIY